MPVALSLRSLSFSFTLSLGRSRLGFTLALLAFTFNLCGSRLGFTLALLALTLNLCGTRLGFFFSRRLHFGLFFHRLELFLTNLFRVARLEVYLNRLTHRLRHVGRRRRFNVCNHLANSLVEFRVRRRDATSEFSRARNLRKALRKVDSQQLSSLESRQQLSIDGAVVQRHE